MADSSTDHHSVNTVIKLHKTGPSAAVLTKLELIPWTFQTPANYLFLPKYFYLFHNLYIDQSLIFLLHSLLPESTLNK